MNGCGASTQKRWPYGHAEGWRRHHSAAPTTRAVRMPATRMLHDRNILDAAATVLARDGAAGFTLERVASEAGVSRVTLHRRGIGRPELLQGLAAQAREDFRE